MKTELKIEYLPVSALKPYGKNARKHKKLDVDNIAMSIEKYGMNDAIGILQGQSKKHKKQFCRNRNRGGTI